MARALSLLALSLTLCHAALGARYVASVIGTNVSSKLDPAGLVKPTFSGYLPVASDGSAMYYAFYESQSAARAEDIGEAPIVLWLQGGPGCASTFGAFYELGPWSVNPNLSVQRNPGG
ncbi:Serine carboxypeptidase-like 50, partial [Tetrabaena socialis]